MCETCTGDLCDAQHARINTARIHVLFRLFAMPMVPQLTVAPAAADAAAMDNLEKYAALPVETKSSTSMC